MEESVVPGENHCLAPSHCLFEWKEGRLFWGGSPILIEIYISYALFHYERWGIPLSGMLAVTVQHWLKQMSRGTQHALGTGPRELLRLIYTNNLSQWKAICMFGRWEDFLLSLFLPFWDETWLATCSNTNDVNVAENQVTNFYVKWHFCWWRTMGFFQPQSKGKCSRLMKMKDFLKVEQVYVFFTKYRTSCLWLAA